MKTVIILVGIIAAVAAVSENPQRIIGGSVTTINTYPYASSLLYSYNLVTYTQACGGVVLNTRSILSAAHCFYGDAVNRWRVRVGSTYANSGGTVFTLLQIITHGSYSTSTYDNDVAILRVSGTMNAAAVSIAGVNYNLADNQSVYAIGWGATSVGGALSEQLRHVQVWVVNQTTCATRYREVGMNITDNMLCSGWLDVGGRDQCQGDDGGPLIHNGVQVGIRSWSNSCGLARFPGVNTRISRFTTWIQANA